MSSNSEHPTTRRRGTPTVKLASAAGAVAKSSTVRQRMTYSQSFKLEVVRHSLRLPESARIKPTCRAYPGIEPVQIRKWIKNLAPLAMLMRPPETTAGNGTPPRSPSPASEPTEPPGPLSIQYASPRGLEQAPLQPAQPPHVPWQHRRFPAEDRASHIDLAHLGSDPVWTRKLTALREEADGTVLISRTSSSTTMTATPTYLSHSASPTPLQDHSWVWPNTPPPTSAPTLKSSSSTAMKHRRSVSLLGIAASKFVGFIATTPTHLSHPASPAPIQNPHPCPTSTLAPQAVSSLYGPYALSPLAVNRTLPHPAFSGPCAAPRDTVPPAPPAPPASRHTSPLHPWGIPASNEGIERDTEQAAAAQELLSLFRQGN